MFFILAIPQHPITMGDDTGDEQLNLKVLGQDGQIVQVGMISLKRQENDT